MHRQNGLFFSFTLTARGACLLLCSPPGGLSASFSFFIPLVGFVQRFPIKLVYFQFAEQPLLSCTYRAPRGLGLTPALGFGLFINAAPERNLRGM